MATRLYFAGGAPTISPAFDASWELGVNRGLLRSSKDGTSAMSTGTASTALNTPAGAVDVAWAQFISKPLRGNGTIAGQISGVMRVLESAAAADLRVQCVIRVLSEDGTTVRGTLVASDTGALSSEWDAATLTNRKFPRGGPVTPTAVAYSDRDRLVVEIGFRKHESAVTNRTGSFRFGNPVGGTDLTLNETGTSDDVPWLELADDVGFYGEVDFVAQASALVNGTSVVVNVPAGTLDGDLMVMVVADSGASGAIGWAPPAGWASDLADGYREVRTGSARRIGIAYRIASSEPASYTVSFASGKTTVEISTWRGADTTDPFIAYRQRHNAVNSKNHGEFALYFLPTNFTSLTINVVERGGGVQTTPPGYTTVYSAQFDGDTSSASNITSIAYQKFNKQRGAAAHTWVNNLGATGSPGEGIHLAIRPAGSTYPLALRSMSRLGEFTAGTSFIVPQPPDYHVGDLLVAVVLAMVNTAPHAIPSPPAGWSQKGSTRFNDNTSGASRWLAAAVFYKVAAGGDSFTFASNKSVQDYVVFINAYNARPVAPSIIAQNDASDTSSNTTQDMPGLTLEDYTDEVLDLIWIALSTRNGNTAAPGGFEDFEQSAPPVDPTTSVDHHIQYQGGANPAATSGVSTNAAVNVVQRYAVAAIVEGVGARRYVVMI
jgi:hypothetical protein